MSKLVEAASNEKKSYTQEQMKQAAQAYGSISDFSLIVDENVNYVNRQQQG